ncbi:hypothetical protein QBZ16_003250, partial [Prototheca wickerhamii]
AAARGKKTAAVTEADPDDPLASQYGDLPMVQSVEVTDKKWTAVSNLTTELENTEVLVRARLHAVRGKGKSAFLVLRQQLATVQAVLFVDDTTVSKGMVKYASAIPRESIVDITGIVAKPNVPVEGCSQSEVEIKVTSVRAVVRSEALPFEISDAARSKDAIEKALAAGEAAPTVGQDTRLDNRVVDLRTPANQGIFRVQSAVCQAFRDFLLSKDFMEIHTPKLVPGASEGGAAVFKLDYMGRPACLGQSPQLYKQMAICAGLGKVFEIGPVFRAEFSYTHRHLCEFTGLDFEMAINESYHEVLDVVNELFVHMFEFLNNKCAKELAAINEQYPFEPLKYLPQAPRLTFAEGVELLKEAGIEVDPFGDLNTEAERALGKIVAEKYKTDFYILHRYPQAVRPFYTMPCKDDPRYSNSYDIFIRGEEIISGAQRIHDPVLLEQRARDLGVPVESIRAYIDSFKYGAPPHGGIGVGMERVVMLFCGLDNIRKTSMFPRDPKRLEP